MNGCIRRRAFVVEDEALMAMLLEEMLRDLGYEVSALSATLEQALDLARTAAFDFALLDVNLNGQQSFPVADAVRRRGLPVLFATGYGRRILAPPYLDAPLLQKPFSIEELRRMLDGMGL